MMTRTLETICAAAGAGTFVKMKDVSYLRILMQFQILSSSNWLESRIVTCHVETLLRMFALNASLNRMVINFLDFGRQHQHQYLQQSLTLFQYLLLLLK
jgi:hypothetical protein